MKVKRTLKIRTDRFEQGDVIRFKLDNGEKVEAIALNQVGDSMLFIFRDCLEKEYPMNSEGGNEGGYEESDLRRNLNGEILDRFPYKIRCKMVAFENGDMLRLPTEKEIFGCNDYGEDESDVKQFTIMKQRRNRIAFQGLNGAWEWYWLQNKVKNSAASFAHVGSGGSGGYTGASYSFGVRPLFLLKIVNRESRPLVGRDGKGINMNKNDIPNMDWNREQLLEYIKNHVIGDGTKEPKSPIDKYGERTGSICDTWIWFPSLNNATIEELWQIIAINNTFWLNKYEEWEKDSRKKADKLDYFIGECERKFFGYDKQYSLETIDKILKQVMDILENI